MPTTSVDGRAAGLQGSARPMAGDRYAGILKATALIGGSSVVNIALGIFRTKVMALLLGPGGVGLMGLYTSIADLTQAVAGFGIQNSGVRQIAEAAGTDDPGRIARTAAVLRRVSLATGLLGASILLVSSEAIASVTFGSADRRTGVMLLAVAVFLRLVSAGQGALIQGMRRIPELARMGVLAALSGTFISIPLVYWFGEDGVVPSLVGMGAAALAMSWWYSRRIPIPHVRITASDVTREASALLKLGFAFMASAFLTMGAAYAVRLIVLRTSGFEAAGLYQAAWALGGLYVGFILQAMGADFYPRLTAVATDHVKCNRLVNEQTEVSLLLAGPGVIATLTFAPLVIAVFYSAEFGPAVSVLRWICLGMMLRVFAWPMGFIILAKGAQQIFFWTEVAATVVHVGLAWALVNAFGLDGAGAAFFGLYAWHAMLIYVIVRRYTGFRWSRDNRQVALLLFPVAGLVFVASYLLPLWLSTTTGVVAVGATGIYSLRKIVSLLPVETFPSRLRPVLAWAGAPVQTPSQG